MRAWAAVRPFLRTPRPPLAPGPLPLRGAAPARRARRRFAAPVRRFAPSLRCAPVAWAAPRASPPALPLGPCAPLCGSAGARWPRCAWAPPLCAAGFLRCAPVALASRRARRCASRGPAGSPLARPRGLRASGLRLRRFAPGAPRRRASAPRLRRPLAASGTAAPAPGPLLRARACAGLLGASWGRAARCCGPDLGLRPCLPPAPAAPSGGSRGAPGWSEGQRKAVSTCKPVSLFYSLRSRVGRLRRPPAHGPTPIRESAMLFPAASRLRPAGIWLSSFPPQGVAQPSQAVKGKMHLRPLTAWAACAFTGA